MASLEQMLNEQGFGESDEGLHGDDSGVAADDDDFIDVVVDDETQAAEPRAVEEVLNGLMDNDEYERYTETLAADVPRRTPEAWDRYMKAWAANFEDEKEKLWDLSQEQLAQERRRRYPEMRKCT